MSGPERYKKLHELEIGSPEQPRELALTIPLLFRFREQILEESSLYNARFTNFFHKFCSGRVFKLVVGRVLELWDGGTYRDGDFFFSVAQGT